MENTRQILTTLGLNLTLAIVIAMLFATFIVR